mgnify:CR=1 FL=1
MKHEEKTLCPTEKEEMILSSQVEKEDLNNIKKKRGAYAY